MNPGVHISNGGAAYSRDGGKRSPASTVDWWLIACYLLLVLAGMLNIYAATHIEENPVSLLNFSCRYGKQAIWILTSLLLATLIMFVIPPRLYEAVSPFLYCIVLVLLVAVIFIGSSINGSHSWFSFGGISFQPAEISKTVTALMLATLMGQSGFRLKGAGLWLAATIILLPMAAIVMEKETGSALVYAGFAFMLYREGLSGWLLALFALAILCFILTITLSADIAIIVLMLIISFADCLRIRRLRLWFGISAALLCLDYLLLDGTTRMLAIYIESGLYLLYSIWRAFRFHKQIFRWISCAILIGGIALCMSSDFFFNDVLKEYQRNRIEILLGMKEDISGVGYNVYQSKVAIGSGGLFGKGFCNGMQTAYGFVPEQSTDFIFCTVGEEWGFAGCLLLIGIYFFMLVRIILDSERSRSVFNRVYGYSIASILFMHLFINIGMTIGIMPVIGIPLPFVSYGGSSMWSFTIMLFIFIALIKNERKYF